MTVHARRLGRWTLRTVMVLVTLACAAWLLPAVFGYSPYVITSGSMTGIYDRGSVVFEKKVAAADLQVGEVITYLPPADSGVHHLVTHRIFRVQPVEGGGALFTTKGDDNASADPWHFELGDEQQSVAQFGLPEVGWVYTALAHKPVRLLAIGLPAALIGLRALTDLILALRRREDETPDHISTRWIPPSIVEQEYEVA